MHGKPDGLRSLAKYSKVPVERICYLPDADEEVVKGIGRGILFQMAFWSGPSFTAFAKLTEVISMLDPGGLIEFVVADIDGAQALSAASKDLGGCKRIGETAWIRNGRIVATTGIGFNVECMSPNTELLLAMP